VKSGLDAVHLLGVARQPVGGFSGGMRRRLSVAISFIGSPSVVYLDEPSSVSILNTKRSLHHRR